jgi:hypothetical protein
MAFRTFQTELGAGDWDLTTGAKPLTPDKDSRMITAIIAFGGYVVILITFFLARKAFPSLFNLICTMIIANMCLY